jgi:hypothetical protein
MTVINLTGVGYCARLDTVGDWAFRLALSLVRRHNVVLDVFFFPEPFGQAHLSRGRRGGSVVLSERAKIELEKKVRLYYDERLGDFVNVGFRLCEGDEEPELRRCLIIRREYDVLVLPYPGCGLRVGGRSIEEFAEAMPCPTILVGPDREDSLHVNSTARIWIDRLGLRRAQCQDLFPVRPSRE